MNRTFFSFAIFFFSIYLLISVFQSIVHFQLGKHVLALHSAVPWLFFSFGTSLLIALLLLTYYRYQQFYFTFWAFVASVVCSVLQFAIFVNIYYTHEMSAAYLAIALLATVIGLVYAASLIFSPAGKRLWLKLGGIFSLLIHMATLGFFILALTSEAALADGTIERLEQWIGLFGSPGSLFMLINFVQERSELKKQQAPSDDVLIPVMSLAALAVTAGTLILAPQLTTEAIRKYNNPNEVNSYVMKAAESYEPALWVSKNGKTLPYRLLKPIHYDSTQAYPLVVCLHGSSGCGSDNYKQVLAALPAQMLARDSVREKYPAFVLVPQCPERQTWGGIDGVTSVDSLVMETISALQRKFALDTSRCYIAGNSLGGYGTWHLIGKYPRKFAAAVPICGKGDPAIASNLIDIPIWAFHGAKDQNVPVSGSREIIQAIKRAGGNPRYTEYPDAAHDINHQVMKNTEVLDWMFRQAKK